jgi:eukaryotic-like serine/threonine-protein kinase
MALAGGTRLGPYEIVAPLGAGGMGEVYRARDGRLGRDVAVKVLPTQLADDPDRRRRFELEARAAGALNHPSVLAVLDVGVDGSTVYLVTELLDGETLRAKLAGGALPLRKAIEWAVQIAQGLAAAHEKGIVHRDLKPENLFVTRDGRVKILDFGLAKAVTAGDAAAGSETDSTRTEGATGPGAVLGSAGYMAPEQVMATSVDARTDLFAFGAVLYELLTGQRAFGEGTPVERAYAILKDDPPAPTQVNPDVSPALELVVRRCLEKSPEERFQSARDLAFHLQSISTTSGLGGGASLVPTSLPPRRVPRAALVGAALAAAAGAAIPAYVLGRRVHSAAPHGATLAPAAAARPAQPRYSRLTFRRGLVTDARFVPGGRSIVYSALFGSGRPQILTVTAGQPESRVLGDNLFLFALSSTGELAVAIPSASLLAAPTLGRMALVASTPRAVVDGISRADWAPDGTHLAIVIDDQTAQRIEYPIGQVLAKVTGEIGAVRVSPDGKLVAFVYWPTQGDNRGTVELVDAEGARRTVAGPFFFLQGLAWSADGRELWFSAGATGSVLAIHAATLDGQDRVVGTGPAWVTLLDRAADGRILVSVDSSSRCEIQFHAPGDAGERELSWFDCSVLADVSADGKTLLFAEGCPSTTTEIMIYTRPTSGGPAVPLGEGEPYALSPDGKWVLAAPRTPRLALELLPTGAGQPRVLPKGPIAEYGEFGGFFPDGERIWFLARNHDVPRLWVQDLAAGDPRPLVDRAVFASSRPLSPDGKTFLLGDPSDGSFFELAAAGGARRPRTLPAGAFPFGWTSDGGLYLVRRLPDIASWAVTRWSPTTRREQAVRTLRADTSLIPARGGVRLADRSVVGGQSNFFFAPDGSWYAFQYTRHQGDLYLVEGLE